MLSDPLFLDEVGEFAASLQARLVHELDKASGKRRRAHVISAPKRDLDQDRATRRFGEDLFFRLNVMEIRIPPLRESPEDILALTRALLTSLSVDLGRPPPVLSDAVVAKRPEHRWFANLRELKIVIERALLTRPSDGIEPEAFPDISPPTPVDTLSGAMTSACATSSERTPCASSGGREAPKARRR